MNSQFVSRVYIWGAGKLLMWLIMWVQMQPRHWPVIIFIKKIVSGPGPGPSGASLITNQAVTALPGQASQAAAASRSTQPSLDSCRSSRPLSPAPTLSPPVTGRAGPEPAAVTPARPACVQSSSLPTVGCWAAVSKT